MPELLRESRPKARKDHHCDWCAAVIPAGTVYHRDVYVYDGHAYDWVCCDGCDAINGEVYEWAYQPDEGVGPEDYAAWAEEHVNDPELGERARAYLARAGIEPYTPAPAGGEPAFLVAQARSEEPAGAPKPTTSEEQCETCGRILSCVRTCSKCEGTEHE